MKRLMIMVLIVLMLTGCGAKQTLETVDDVYVTQLQAETKKVSLSLPEDAVLMMVNGEKRLYFCGGYELYLETFSSSSIETTLQMLTGYNRSSLTVMEIPGLEVMRYECVWTAAAEAGDMVGRTVILDDGYYHYCLSVITSANEAGSLQETWNDLTLSFQV